MRPSSIYLSMLLLFAGGCVIYIGGSKMSFRQQRNLELTVQDAAPDETVPGTITGTWKGTGLWQTSSGMMLSFRVQDKNQSVAITSYWVDENSFKTTQAEETPNGSTLSIDRPAGTLTLTGEIRSGKSGDYQLTVNQSWLNSISQLTGQPVRLTQYFNLWTSNVSLEYAQQLKAALGDKFNLDGLISLSRNGVAADYITDLQKQGYDFSVDDIVQLHRFGIHADYAGSYKTAGYNFSADDLVKVNRFGLKAGEFAAFRDAGYDFDIDTMIQANRFGIKSDEARRYRQAGYDFSVDDLIQTDRFGLKPDDFVKFHEAGYEFDIETMIQAKRFNINPDQAARYRQAGYDFNLENLIELNRFGITPEYAVPLRQAGYEFSVDNLVQLKRFGIPVDYMTTLADPDYENFTADEILNMKRSGMDASTIKKVRQKKTKTQP